MTTFWLMILLFLIPFAMLYIDQAKDRKDYAALIAKERAGHATEAARQQAEKARATARQTYHTALKALRQKPCDPEVYQSALDAGRAYAALTTTVDEQALHDDLLAATTVAERLAKLETLRRQGLVANTDYYERRHAILHEV